VGLGMSVILASGALYYAIFDTWCFNSHFSVLQIFKTNNMQPCNRIYYSNVY